MINDVSLFFGIALIFSFQYHYNIQKKNSKQIKKFNNKGCSTNKEDNKKEQNESIFYPPLPKEILDVLK